MSDNNIFPEPGMELTTILVISDLNASKKFYTEILGASLEREYGGSSAVLKFLGNWILLVTPGDPTEDKPSTSFTIPVDKNKVSHSFTMRVENCQRSYEERLRRGAEFITPPYDWGAEVRCFFRDPDGHLLEISEFRG